MMNETAMSTNKRSSKPAKKTTTSLSPEAIQEKIDAAEAKMIYYDVTDDKWKRVVVIGGAKKRWMSGSDFVFAPGGRLCGPREEVLAKLDEYEIDVKDLYESVDSPGFQEELDTYQRERRARLPSDEEMENLKKAIKQDTEKPSLKRLLKELAPGRVINVTDIAEGKYSVVNAPSLTSSARFVGAPGLDIVSKTEESYTLALDELGVAEEKRDLYLEVYRALAKLQKPEAPAKSVKKAPASAPKKAPAAAPKKGSAGKAKKTSAKK